MKIKKKKFKSFSHQSLNKKLIFIQTLIRNKDLKSSIN